MTHAFIQTPLPQTDEPIDNHLPLTGPQRQIRHILLGHPLAIRHTIHLLHTLGYVDPARWSALVDLPQNQLVLPVAAEEQISLLRRRLTLL